MHTFHLSVTLSDAEFAKYGSDEATFADYLRARLAFLPAEDGDEAVTERVDVVTEAQPTGV